MQAWPHLARQIGAGMGRDRRLHARQPPAVDRVPQADMPADAVVVDFEIRQPAAPVGRIQHGRDDQRRARRRVGVLATHRAEGRGQPRQRGLDAVELPHRREEQIVVLQRDVLQVLVAVGVEDVRVVQEQVEDHGTRLETGEALDQLGVHRARPWPLAGLLVQSLETLLVDRHDHDVRRRLPRLGMQPEHPVGERVVDPVERAGQPQHRGDGGQDQQRQAERGAFPGHPREFSRSPARRERRVPSRLRAPRAMG